jgi:hypothetical protein
MNARRGVVLAAIAAAACGARRASSPQELDALRLQVEHTPSEAGERAYLAAFPSSFASFHDWFTGELEPVYFQHLDLLEHLGSTHPDAVLDLQIAIAIGGEWDADAVGMLQGLLAGTAAREPDRFARALEMRSWPAARSVVTFLADVECHAEYPDYERAIAGLRATGHPQWALEFEQARAARMQQPNH